MPAPDEITDRRLNPDYRDLAPAAQEQVLKRQVETSAVPSIQPTPQIDAHILAQATAPEPSPAPSQVDPPRTPAEAELTRPELPVQDVVDMEATGGLSDPTGQGDPDAARTIAADEIAEQREQSQPKTDEELHAEIDAALENPTDPDGDLDLDEPAPPPDADLSEPAPPPDADLSDPAPVPPPGGEAPPPSGRRRGSNS